jgi:hypothetical protein
MEKDYMDISIAISKQVAEKIEAIVNKTDETLGSKAEFPHTDSPLEYMRDYALNWDMDLDV